MPILTVNAGSSSIKLRLVDDDDGIVAERELSAPQARVDLDELRAAQAVAPIATVQNLYNLANRGAEELLDYSAANGIGFIPWFPLATGDLAKPGSPLAELAGKRGASPSQLALAWLLHRSPAMLPIPGTSSVARQCGQS